MTTLFTNGNLVDVIGQTVLTGGSILVENGMIKEVGTSIAVPNGAKVVDLGGRTVLPGLFNCHVHMCSDAGTGAKETISDAAVTIRALKNLKTLLNSGVTYIRDAGAPKYIDVDLHDAQLKGEILAPEMQTACRCICMTGGHGHDSGREADGPDDCRRAAREQLKAGANWIKVMATGGVMTKGVEPGSPQLTEEELRSHRRSPQGRGQNLHSCPGHGRHQKRSPGRRGLHRARLLHGRLVLRLHEGAQRVLRSHPGRSLLDQKIRHGRRDPRLHGEEGRKDHRRPPGYLPPRP